FTMPARLATACKISGCHHAKPCPVHPADADPHSAYHERRRLWSPLYAGFYRSGAWKRLSEDHRKRHPLCEVCKAKGLTKLVDLVDHIVELEDGGAALDPSNLQSLCYSCHRSKTDAAAAARKGRAGQISGPGGSS